MFEVLVVSDLFGMLVAFDRVVLGNASDALCAKKTKWTRDPGVALDHPRETRLPQATVCHAFSVKMQAGCPRSQH